MHFRETQLSMQTPVSILQKYWHYDSFRPMQEEIINSVLAGKDTLALLPTGGGKSICFQVPALLQNGLCLVISPLIALMRDQVDGLLQKDIPAAALYNGLTHYEVTKLLEKATTGNLRFLYVSPERLQTRLFKEYLPALQISLLVVDEAHCISQWGYDFRPSYLRIAELRNELPGISMIALTASATPLVQQDILAKLKFNNQHIFRQSFERANLSYSVFEVDSKINKAFEILNRVSGSSIVYCSSRRQTKELAELLCLQNIAADFYHAGLPQEIRNQKQQAWIQNEIRVMVCTNAFGMGIDKPDVRTVIHYDLTDCLESYYQEAGRAGRDGKKSYAVLLYQHEHLAGLQELSDKRFPPIPQIKKIYQALADYLQVPVGIGEGNYYDFDLAGFIANFKLDSLLVINTLKVLEQEGHISFSENIFLPTQVCFNAGKDELYSFEVSNPKWEPLIKCLLRTYEGIIDNRVSIYEKQVARLCRLPVDEVKEGLLQLQAYDIIEYLPQKETPQIHYLLNRAPAKYLLIDQDHYLQRKKQYETGIQKMLDYIQLKNTCRSRFIAAHFGDPDLPDCGICDNCLANKRKHLSEAEFSLLEKEIMGLLHKKLSVDKLFVQYSHISKEKLWTVLEFLQSEQLLLIDEEGIMQKIG